MDLAQLLPEDLELAPGRHQLLVCEAKAGALDCQGRSLSIGSARRPEPLEPPLCVLLEPGGTYWQNDAVELLSLALGAKGQAEPVWYRVRHSAGETVIAAISGEKIALELGPGDISIELRCGELPNPPVHRVITVNPHSGAASASP